MESATKKEVSTPVWGTLHYYAKMKTHCHVCNRRIYSNDVVAFFFTDDGRYGVFCEDCTEREFMSSIE